ncbi:MAG: lipoyl(octanoyl) transferase LipB [Burkholderiales bacterium]|jgi:lipoyl(octanoyl) transferase|nr:lipoyl(octanoyl) transferase LipB [Burkholderiales bacterium]
MRPAEVMDLGTQNPFLLRWMGRTDYIPCWRAMRTFTDDRDEATADELWATEHTPVYTLGLSGKREHLLRETDIPVVATDRGGQVTYHGLGQLVLYTLVDIRRQKLGVREMVRRLEEAVCRWLGGFDIAAYGKASAPGVYVRRDHSEYKIAALGLKVKNGRAYHGLSVNIDMSLAPFTDINPCGFAGLKVTQLADFGIRIDLCTAARQLAPQVAECLLSKNESIAGEILR